MEELCLKLSKVRGGAQIRDRYWVLGFIVTVAWDEGIVHDNTALESVSTRKVSAVSLVKLTPIFHPFLTRSPGEVKDLVGCRLRV